MTVAPQSGSLRVPNGVRNVDPGSHWTGLLGLAESSQGWAAESSLPVCTYANQACKPIGSPTATRLKAPSTDQPSSGAHCWGLEC